jgi:hypothetical protein
MRKRFHILRFTFYALRFRRVELVETTFHASRPTPQSPHQTPDQL